MTLKRISSSHIRAKPTIYKGVQMRSILEAKWAAFFDLMKWKWSYEPHGFDGWLPDFVLHGNEATEAQGRLYVEVKKYMQLCEETVNKIARSGCRDDVLIVSPRGPFVSTSDDVKSIPQACWSYSRNRHSQTMTRLTDDQYLWSDRRANNPAVSWHCRGAAMVCGWLGQTSGELEHDWMEAVLADYRWSDDDEEHIGICHPMLSWTDSITGKYIHGDLRPVPDEKQVRERWITACNLVQWRAPK